MPNRAVQMLPALAHFPTAHSFQCCPTLNHSVLVISSSKMYVNKESTLNKTFLGVHFTFVYEQICNFVCLIHLLPYMRKTLLSYHLICTTLILDMRINLLCPKKRLIQLSNRAHSGKNEPNRAGIVTIFTTAITSLYVTQTLVAVIWTLFTSILSNVQRRYKSETQ